MIEEGNFKERGILFKYKVTVPYTTKALSYMKNAVIGDPNFFDHWIVIGGIVAVFILEEDAVRFWSLFADDRI